MSRSLQSLLGLHHLEAVEIEAVHGRIGSQSLGFVIQSLTALTSLDLTFEW